MNINKILRDEGYHTLSYFGDVAKYAANYTKEHFGCSETDVLDAVFVKFGGPPEWLEMEESFKDYNVFGEALIENGTYKQMETAMSLPVAIKGALMPDAHVGYALPIGGVVALDNAISPSFVGYDIACRVSLSVLDLEPDDLDWLSDRQMFADDMVQVSRFGRKEFEAGERDHPVMDDPLWNEINILKNLKPLAQKQLGTSGGGNHFFDAMFGENLSERKSIPDNFVAIMTHSGSRGVGHKLATHYVKLAKKYTSQIAKGIPSGYEWLDLDHEWGQEYLAVMNLMGRYAQANHQLIHEYFCKRTGLHQEVWYENHHNFAWIENDGVAIHRKGATPAHKGQVGLIPGSSGTYSYITEGLGNSDGLYSSSHGAGRPYSRTQAKKNHDEVKYRQATKDFNVIHIGVEQDETLLAYKDIDRVMQAQIDLTKPVARLKPFAVIMGGHSDDGD